MEDEVKKLKLFHPVDAKRTTSCEDPSLEHGFTQHEEFNRRCPHCGARLRVEECGEGRWEPRLGYSQEG